MKPTFIFAVCAAVSGVTRARVVTRRGIDTRGTILTWRCQYARI